MLKSMKMKNVCVMYLREHAVSAQVWKVSSLLKWWCSAQRNNVVDLLYYEQSLCLRCSHTERGSRVQEQLWTIRSKTSQNRRAVSYSSCTSHRRPVTFVLLIVYYFFKGLAGTIGHLEAFMWGKNKRCVLILTLHFRGRTTQGWKLSKTPCHSKEQQLKTIRIRMTNLYFCNKKKHLNWNTERALHISTERWA